MKKGTNKDTVKLMRQCDSGIKMGISYLSDVLPLTENPQLEDIFRQSKLEHEELRAKTEQVLNRCRDKGKNPPAIALEMSRLKTKLTLAGGNDPKAARLVEKGCNMGISSLEKYLEKYPTADMTSKKITNSIIQTERKLIGQLQKYE